MDNLLADLDSGILVIRSEHERLECNLSQLSPHAGAITLPADADFAIVTREQVGEFVILTELPLILYSQRDSRWRNEVYAGGVTFGAAGCYTVAVAMILSFAGYTDTPPEVAAKLRAAGCYSGALLTQPERIPDAYPLTCYDGTVRWHDVPADMARFREELAKGPCITEVDFQPGGPMNQHFILCLGWADNDEDLIIADPWDGCRTKLLSRYAQDSWDLARALYGVRLLRTET